MSRTSIRLLFVCTANVCRSPLALGYMALHASNITAPIRVSSASTDNERRDLHPFVRSLLLERSIELHRTESQVMSRDLVDQADLILTMTAQHAISVVARFADVKPKVFLLDHFATIVRPQLSTESFTEWLAQLYAYPRDYSRFAAAADIDDPIGKDEAAFRSVAARVDELTGWIATVLASARVEADG